MGISIITGLRGFDKGGEIFMTIEVVTVTPEMAKAWLEKNQSNRPIRTRVVDALVRDIQNGNFRLTHQGIAFDEDGNLLDGQHRLTAVALSGVPTMMTVTHGLRAEDMQFIDIGIKRTFADTVTISGEGDDYPAMRNNGMILAVRNLIQLGYKTSIIPTNSEIKKVFFALAPYIRVAYKCMSSRGGGPGPATAAVIAALINQEPEEDVYDFCTVFVKGDSSKCTDKNFSAAFVWQKQLMEAKMKHTTFAKIKLYNGTQNAIFQFIHSENTTLIRQTKELRYPVGRTIQDILR